MPSRHAGHLISLCDDSVAQLGEVPLGFAILRSINHTHSSLDTGSLNDCLQKRWKPRKPSLTFTLISSQTSRDVLYHKPAFLWALGTVFI